MITCCSVGVSGDSSGMNNQSEITRAKPSTIPRTLQYATALRYTGANQLLTSVHHPAHLAVCYSTEVYGGKSVTNERPPYRAPCSMLQY